MPVVVEAISPRHVWLRLTWHLQKQREPFVPSTIIVRVPLFLRALLSSTKSLHPHSQSKTESRHTSCCHCWINVSNAQMPVITGFLFLMDGSVIVTCKVINGYSVHWILVLLRKSHHWVMSWSSHLRRYQQSLNAWEFLLKQIGNFLIY